MTAFCHTDHLGVHIQPKLTRWFGPAVASAGAGAVRRAIRSALSPFDAVFAAGRLQVERLRAAGVPRVVHVPFGVDKAVFQPSARSDETRRYWIGDGRAEALLFVGLGRLAGEKRWDVVLEAFAQVRHRHDAVLVLVGDGPERARLERLAPAGVRFAGFEHDRARLARLLASADLLVHGAPCETFGLAIAEGVACGLPIVVPNAGAAPEHVFQGSGETYRGTDPVACADAIGALLARPQDRRRAVALSAAERVLSAEHHFGQVVSVYEDLLRNRRRRSGSAPFEPHGCRRTRRCDLPIGVPLEQGTFHRLITIAM
jgi:alpha-1,6-mannosyltransferase